MGLTKTAHKESILLAIANASHYIHGMIICVCNRLSSAKLEAACASGVREACEFYAREGCAMNCGKCLDFVEDFIDRSAVARAVPGSAFTRANAMQPQLHCAPMSE